MLRRGPSRRRPTRARARAARRGGQSAGSQHRCESHKELSNGFGASGGCFDAISVRRVALRQHLAFVFVRKVVGSITFTAPKNELIF